MNINENIRNMRKIVKDLKGVHMQIYIYLSCLLSYTTSRGTNLMLKIASLINGPICKLSKNCIHEYLLNIRNEKKIREQLIECTCKITHISAAIYPRSHTH